MTHLSGVEGGTSERGQSEVWETGRLHDLVAHWKDLRAKAAEVGFACAGKNRGFEASGVCEGLDRCIGELEPIAAIIANLIVKWRQSASEFDEDGDFCCGQIRRHDADDLLAALREAGQEPNP
jgi:hypothetical protein